VQFHFHKPSEERINGRSFDMVIHLVHKDDEGRLAVVAVLLQRGEPQPQIQAVWNALPLERGSSLASPVPIDLPALLPKDPHYLTYMGSLTTPPCTEGAVAGDEAAGGAVADPNRYLRPFVSHECQAGAGGRRAADQGRPVRPDHGRRRADRRMFHAAVI
jgi:hypothetical protein